jgi:hypothetical protein
MKQIPTREEKNQMIADAIANISAGVLVEVSDASGCVFSVCLGDLRDIGWTEKITSRRSMNWRYTGPNPITVDGKIINSGEYTEEIDMDWR